MNLKYRLIEEVLKIVASNRHGTPQNRRIRQNTLISVINNLIHLGICPGNFHLFTTDHLSKLIVYWDGQGNTISTIRNKVSILKWYLTIQNIEPPFPSLKELNLIRPKNKVRAYIDASISEQVFNPLVKSIIDFQFQFGLSHIEAMRIDLGSSLQNDDLFISRKIAHNRKSRYISIMSKSQKLAIKDRQGLTHTHPTFTDIIPEPLLIGLYKAELYQCGIKDRVDMRHYYARNKLAELERKKVDKDKAYKMVMSDMGFTAKQKLMEFLS